MATLTGTTIQSTYDSLLKVTDNDSITGSLKRITDGLGNNTPLYLSSSAVEIVSALNVIGNITGTNLSGTNTGDETKASIESKLGAATSSNSGYLTSTDWSTFNNKIAGSGTLNKLAKFSSSSSIADSTITDTGSAVTIGVATTVSGNLTATSLIKSGGTSSQFLKADGSVDSSSYIILSSLSATSPLSYNNTTGAFSIQQASGSQNGFLSSTDWTTFNNKQNALTNPVTGTGTTNTLPKFTGSTAIGDSNITDTGSLITLGSNSYIGGQVGIGTSSLGVHSLTISLQLQNSATIYGVLNNGVAQSTATNAVNYFGTVSNTAAGSYTIPILRHYIANGGTFGAGSVVSTQVGYDVNSTLNGATTNYGFRGRLAAATGVWNLYMDGTANNYLAGALGIGTTTLTGYNINIARNLTGAVTSRGIQQAYTVQSDVTNAAIIYSSAVSTQATAFTLPQLTHYFAGQGTIGAGSTITDQHGFRVESSLIGATNNYGFRGQIAAGTGRWNLYMDGTANNHLAGALGIGSTSLATTSLRISRNGTGGTQFLAIDNQTVFQSDVTVAGIGYNTFIGTQATAFTLAEISHFRATQGTIGAGSTVTTQVGFNVTSGLIGSTNNYGFRGSIPSGTGRFNLYMDGTADNYLAGGLAIGTTTLTGHSVRINKTITGATTAYGIRQGGVVQSDVTTAVYANFTSLDTQAASFTLPEYGHYVATQGVIGAGSAVTSQYGYVAASNMIGATNNYGFYGNIASGTGRWNLYMAGTASNYLAGNTAIGTTTPFSSAGYRTLTVGGGAGILGQIVWNSGATPIGYAYNDATNMNIGSDAALIFRTTASATERVRIFSGGNVAIGSSTDNNTGAKLQVTGGMTYQNLFNRRTASYTLTINDQNYIVEMNVGSANNLTIPPNSSVALPIGTEIAIIQYGAGQTTIVAGAGVTLRSKSNALKISGQYAGCTCVKVGTDEWYVIGDLTI